MAENPLKKQLDHQKFLSTIEYVRKAATGPKTLSVSELALINLHIQGLPDDFEPWRFTETTVKIPTGQEHRLSVLQNPLQRARDIIGAALRMSGANQGFDAAVHIYSELVLAHLFISGNRRTGVAAATWILLMSNLDCDANELLALPVGDLRDPSDAADLREKISGLIKS